ncbi:hypothetical protein TREMEDRAFT_44550 [Tremella mesenterica DSM 1558]|uniref:uncharacterized protein n=1 Tax=Tremella mesenterica (strain ATCC 24925 / CBS 8224 / DSM 1558 / NBRC 9311 / NRRL Y-6157 / RJB 2259-6 / UBC 559-6) TaxID=578456 RepID=UPI0003F48D86|nr:uncharacterized protein TREMEDRAFT_44550 [Tremella mesenterica DSM 1558]EIW68733.1 hypothetical protein TREMEDRAFT_44550 [Tremella mesenterica DSM 1558]
MAIQMDDPGPSTGPFTLSHTLTGHARSVTALRFTHDNSQLLSAGADGYVHFWDSKSGQHRRSIRCHTTGINDLSISPDNLYFATASDDSLSLIFPISPTPSSEPYPTGRSRPIRILHSHTAAVLCVAFNPKGNLLVTGSLDESAILWDIAAGKPLRTLPAHSEAIWSVDWDREGGMVMTASADGLIRLWDTIAGQCLRTFDNETNSPVSHASFTPSPFFLLSTSLSSTIRVYGIYNSKVLKTLASPAYINEKYPCPTYVFASPEQTSNEYPNGEVYAEGEDGSEWMRGPIEQALVVAGSENGNVVLWDLGSKKTAQVLGGHTRPVVALAVSSDGKIIASGSLEPENSIKVWIAK